MTPEDIPVFKRVAAALDRQGERHETTKREAAETMRRLEETADAAMVGWAKAATEVERLTAERDRAKGIAEGLHKELRDAVAARGQAERERDEVRAELERVRADTLTEAINAVTEQQMKDAATTSALEQDDMACSSFCGHGRTCHTAEAHAAHNRALAALRRALGRSGT